eukprot:4323882-Pleurochrysis_carterae.AAC.1
MPVATASATSCAEAWSNALRSSETDRSFGQSVSSGSVEPELAKASAKASAPLLPILLSFRFSVSICSWHSARSCIEPAMRTASASPSSCFDKSTCGASSASPHRLIVRPFFLAASSSCCASRMEKEFHSKFTLRSWLSPPLRMMSARPSLDVCEPSPTSASPLPPSPPPSPPPTPPLISLRCKLSDSRRDM